VETFFRRIEPFLQLAGWTAVAGMVITMTPVSIVLAILLAVALFWNPGVR
jgi:hypothetical protein